jgi:archaellum component FlaF (FlaF/FlaG flagellin family)
MFNRIRSTADSLINGPKGISPSVDRFLDEHGDEQITQMIISRNIISSLITSSLNIISPNFKKKNNNNPLYHLKILIKTDRAKISVEKNERISISNYKMNKGAENMNVNIPNGLSLNVLLDRTKQLMGGKFLTYSSRDNNCQHFILAMLQSNNLSTSQNILFTKQATQHLFTPQLRKITNTITDLAGKFDILRQGGDIKPKNRWIQHVQEFAKDNNIGYFKALSDPKCKSTYIKKT